MLDLLHSPMHHLLAAAVGGAPGEGSNNATVWDTTDFSQHTSVLAYPASSKLFSFAIFFKFASTTPSVQTFWLLDGGKGVGALKVQTDATGKFSIKLHNGTGTVVLEVLQTTRTITDTNLHSFIFSCDLSDTGKRHFFIDGVATAVTWTTYTDSVIDWSTFSAPGSEFSDNALPGRILATVGSTWLSMDQYFDHSDSAVLLYHRTVLNRPTALESDGSSLDSVVLRPQHYFFDGHSGTNPGTGAAFTVTGSPASGTIF